MNPRHLLLRGVGGLLLSLALTGGAGAELLASSASSATSASLGSISDSLGRSSDSSSPRQVADGDWRILEIAERTDRPGALQLRLQPLAPEAQGGDDLLLTLPAETARTAALAVGQTVRSRARPWGLRFALVDQAEPFYLVLADARHRTLQAQPVF